MPGRYINYDLYKVNTVVLYDYRGKSKYTKYKFHKVKYNKGINLNHKNVEYKKSKGHAGEHN